MVCSREIKVTTGYEIYHLQHSKLKRIMVFFCDNIQLLLYNNNNSVYQPLIVLVSTAI